MSEEELAKSYYNLLEDKEILEEQLLSAKITRERYRLLANKYKEVIEEAREYIKDSCYYPELENYSNMTSEEVKELLQILDKVKEK